MEELHKQYIDNSVKILLDKIYNDYGEIYDFSLDDLHDYYKSINITLNQNNKKLNRKTKQKTNKDIIYTEDYCQARTWNNGYINIKHYRKYLNDEVKLDSTKIGGKCAKKITPGNIYCYQHSIKNTHGNYYLLPPKDKLNEYVQTNKLEITLG